MVLHTINRASGLSEFEREYEGAQILLVMMSDSTIISRSTAVKTIAAPTLTPNCVITSTATFFFLQCR